MFTQSAWAEPPAAAEKPTAWSCTVNTLHKGGECVFESEAPAPKDREAQAAQNVATTKTLASAICTVSARDVEGRLDRALQGVCEGEFKAVAPGCSLDGAAVLLDAQARFAPAARACYLRLGEVARQTQLRAATASACCSCLSATPCGSGRVDACYDNLAKRTPGRGLLQCMRGACLGSCSGNLPTQAELDALDDDDELDFAPPPRAPATLPQLQKKTQSHQL